MRSECVRDLGGLPYLGKPRPLPLLNSSTRTLSTKIPRPECSGNLGELRPGVALVVERERRDPRRCICAAAPLEGLYAF